MVLNADKDNRVQSIDPTFTQHWQSKETPTKTKSTVATDNGERYDYTPVPVESSNLQQMHSRENVESSGRRRKKSGTVEPPSTIAVAAKAPFHLEKDDSTTDDDFETKRKRSRSPSHKIESRGSSIRTTNTTSVNSPSKAVQKSSPCEHCFRLEMKIHDL